MSIVKYFFDRQYHSYILGGIKCKHKSIKIMPKPPIYERQFYQILKHLQASTSTKFQFSFARLSGWAKKRDYELKIVKIYYYFTRSVLVCTLYNVLCSIQVYVQFQVLQYCNVAAECHKIIRVTIRFVFMFEQQLGY